MEVVQEGIGGEHSKRRSTLTDGLKKARPGVFESRFVGLSFQHRMHPDIASYSRDIIYKNKALKTANTIAVRDQQVKWNFAASTLPARRVWLDVRGDGDGVNQQELDVIEEGVSQFLHWAADRPPPEGRLWEVACLCFYTKQERAMSEMLQAPVRDRSEEPLCHRQRRDSLRHRRSFPRAGSGPLLSGDAKHRAGRLLG